ncbi:MAG: hypothetical protein GQ561_07220, partial [Calditrichae bacterium]|nr:hypothetical protein [Calditrichia bacterium]
PYMDWVYWRNPTDTSPGSAGYDQYVADAQAGTYDYNSPEVMARTVWVNWNGGDVNDPTFPANLDATIPEESTVFRIISTKPNTTEDIFQFTAPRVITDLDLARLDVEKIKVFPNPYYAYHSQESDRDERFITFTHLPDKATIRIINLAGGQVRKLEKIPGDGSGKFFKWNLNNDSGLPVASGFYIAFIEMPDLDKTKTVKFFILQRKIF